MPIPTPSSGESQQDYVERAHRALATEFPDTDQRNAVIFKTWRAHRGGGEEEKKAHERFTDDEYQHLQDIPVFKEHSYVRILRNKDGSPQVDADGNPRQRVETYDLAALKSITENCNKRIRDTKDFSPITAMHTGKRKPDGTVEHPEIVGFGGPFRLGMYGNEDRDDGSGLKGRWAIYNDEFWFKDKAHRAREMPRRSVEVYVGRPIHDRFLDPITALGAETPALDLGIHYHLNKNGDLVEQYSAPNMTVRYGEDDKPFHDQTSPFLTDEGYKSSARVAHKFSKSEQSKKARDLSVAATYATRKADESEEQEPHIAAHEAHIAAANAHLDAAEHHKGGATEGLHRELAKFHGNHAEYHSALASFIKSHYSQEPTPLPHYDEGKIREAIKKYPHWSKAERGRMDEVSDEIMNHIKGGGGNKFVEHFANHILPGLMKEHYQMPAMPAASNVAPATEVKGKAQYDDDDVKDWHEFHTSEAARHREIAKTAKNKDRHTRFAKWHEQEAAKHEGKLDMSSIPLAGNELRQNFSLALSEILVDKYDADPETVNACVNAMLETQPIKRILTFLDANDAPVNMQNKMGVDQGMPGQQQQPGMGDQPGPEGEHSPAPGESPDEGEEEEVGPQGEQEDGLPNPNEGDDMADDKGKGGAPPAAPEKDEKEKFAMQEIARNQKVFQDEMTAKYDALHSEVVDLRTKNGQLTAERNLAVRTQKVMELRRVYLFNPEDLLTRYGQGEEEHFQNALDFVANNCERSPAGAPSLYTPGLPVPEEHTEEVQRMRQLGGGTESETEEIVRYGMEHQRETGEHLSYDECRKRVKAERTAAAS